MVKVNLTTATEPLLAWKVTYLLRSWGGEEGREYHLPYHVLQQMSNTHPKHRIIYQFQPCILGAFLEIGFHWFQCPLQAHKL